MRQMCDVLVFIWMSKQRDENEMCRIDSAYVIQYIPITDLVLAERESDMRLMIGVQEGGVK